MVFKENSIIICSDNMKMDILKRNFEEKKFFNYTFISLKDFIERYTFKITKEAIVYAMQYLSLSYKNTKTIIQNLYYIDCNDEYNDEKLNRLKGLKKELDDKRLLDYDLYFNEFLKDKNIYLIDQFLDIYQNQIFKEVEKISNVYYCDNEVKPYELDIFSFKKYDGEIDWVFSKILELLLDGVDINKVFIICENKEYTHLLNRYSSLYKIPLYIKETESINNHFIVKEFLSLLATSCLNTALEKIKIYDNSYIYNKIINVLNKFYFVEDNVLLIEVLKDEFNDVYYEEEIFENVIRVVNIDYNFSLDDHVFLVGFNNNTYPKMYLDEGYLSDKYSDLVPLTPTIVKNELERNKAIYLLSKINNLLVSFSENTKRENLLSPITEFIKCSVKEGFNVVGMNRDVDKLKLGIMIDDLINYDIHDAYLDLIYSSIESAYNAYDNNFDFVDKELLNQKINNTIKLSYTSLSTFYKCQFRYYLERVLYIRHESDTTAIMIGNIFHSILEKYGTDGFDLETEKNAQYNNITDLSVRFYFEKLWPDFLLAIKLIEDFKEITYLKDELHEQEVSIDFSNSYFKRLLTGKIDKIMYKNIDGVDYVSIVDYKTGKDIPSLDNVEDGFNLQLPIYAYFLAKTKLLKDPHILGIYLHRILNNVKPSKTKDLMTAKMDALKLDGYSIIKKERLELFDPTYQKSSYIKNMNITKDGSFSKYAKVFSEEDILELINTVEDLLEEAFLNIEEGFFEINPKSINGENKSCKYCPYLNICYRKNKDIKNIKEKKFSETVGDDNGIY